MVMNPTFDNSKYPAPKEVKQGAIPEERIAKALLETNGIQYRTAERLGVSRSCITERIALSPFLQAICAECVEMRIDRAEEGLDILHSKQDLGSICFALKTLGKKRGYTEHDLSKEVDQMKADLKELALALGAGRESRVKQSKDHSD